MEQEALHKDTMEEDSDDGAWLDAMAAAAPGGEEDERFEDLGDVAMPMAMAEEGGDEESWYDSILSHAERTSVVKDESDDSWGAVLRMAVAESVQKGGTTCDMIFNIDTPLKKILVNKFLQGFLPRTISVLEELCSEQFEEEVWYVDNLPDPSAVLCVKTLHPDSASAAHLMSSVIPRSARHVVLRDVDPLHDQSIEKLLQSRAFKHVSTSTRTLFVLPPTMSSLNPPKTKAPREREELKIQSMGESEVHEWMAGNPHTLREGHTSLKHVAGSTFVCIMYESMIVGMFGLSKGGRLLAAFVEKRFQGRGFGKLGLDTCIDDWREKRGNHRKVIYAWVQQTEEDLVGLLTSLGFREETVGHLIDCTNDPS